MFGQGFNSGFFGDPPCFTDTTDIFKDNSGIALYTLDYDASSGKDITTSTLQILGDTSCIATYKLNGSSADLSGNYNGTDTNITYTDGYFGQCASFNGSSSFITLPGNMLNSLTAISASAWVYRRTGSSDAYEYIIAGGDNVSGGRYGIAVNDAGSGSTDNKFYLSDGLASYHTNTVCAYNTWYHVVLTWAGTEMKFYVNGSLDSTFTVASCNFQSSGNGHKIGEYFYNGNYEWEGEIDQVRLFNKAISASEVTTLYNEIGERDGTPTNIDFGVGAKSLYGAALTGTSSQINFPNIPLSAFNATTVSVSLWVNMQALTSGYSSGSYIFRGRGNWIIQVTTNGVIFAKFNTSQGNNGNNQLTYNFPGGTNLNQWYHIVVTDNGTATSGLKLYVDGVLRDSNSGYANIDDNSWIAGIANYAGRAGGNFKVDQLRIFNKVISASEVSKLYGNGAGEIACEHTATTTDVNYPVANTAYYKLDNNAKSELASPHYLFIGDAGNLSSSARLNSVDAEFTYTRPAGYSEWGGSWDPNNKSGSATQTFEESNKKWTKSGGYYNAVWSTNQYSSGKYYAEIEFLAADLMYGISRLTSAVGYGTSLLNDSINYTSYATHSWKYSTTNTSEGVVLSTNDVIGLAADFDNQILKVYRNNVLFDTVSIARFDGTESNIEYRFGRYGQAAVFNGSSSVFDTNLSVPTNWTVSLWLKRTPNGYFGGTTNSSVRSGVYFYSNSDGKLQVYNRNSSGGNIDTLSTSTGLVTEGNWHHIAITFDSTSGTGLTTVYVDSINSGTLDGTPTHSTDFKFGRSGDYAVEYFNGSIDQVRIFSTALSSSQITELYNEKPKIDTSNFKAVLYEGTGSTQYISNVGMDLETNGGLVWVKRRNTSADHYLVDSVRGNGSSTYKNLSSNTQNAEGTTTSSGITNNAFEANGFIMQNSGARTNANGSDYVSWVWKAGGDAVLNTQGSINSNVSANIDAGFSIVQVLGHTGQPTIGHGLSQAPELIINKGYSSSSYGWYVYAQPLGTSKYLQLNTNSAAATGTFWGNPAFTPTNTLFKHNFSGDPFDMIYYCFHSVAGYSKIGTYEGNGTTRNVDLGFDPSWIMIKNVDTGSTAWNIVDTRRDTDTTLNLFLQANTNGAEATTTICSLITNGFSVTGTNTFNNSNGDTFLYMAFK